MMCTGAAWLYASITVISLRVGTLKAHAAPALMAKPSLVDLLRLGQQVQDVIRYQVGEWLTCSVELAPNAFLAKVASDFQKPRGLSVIAFDDIPHKLCHMTLTYWARIGKNMERRLQNFGATTTWEMYQLTRRQTLWCLPSLHIGHSRQKVEARASGQVAADLEVAPLLPATLPDFTTGESFQRQWQALDFFAAGHPVMFHREGLAASGVRSGLLHTGK